ncbi:MAG: hypothetical protein ACLQF2_14440 [Rhodomicrobium sp.]
MDRLPHDLRNFREMVEANRCRAARLVIKVQDEIDQQTALSHRQDFRGAVWTEPLIPS